MCRERRTPRHWSRCGGVRSVWVGECTCGLGVKNVCGGVKVVCCEVVE